MSTEEIANKVAEVVRKATGDRKEFNAASSLADDLGLDMLDRAEVVLDLEEAFGVPIEAEADDLKTVDDLVKAVQQAMGDGGGGEEAGAEARQPEKTRDYEQELAAKDSVIQTLSAEVQRLKAAQMPGNTAELRKAVRLIDALYDEGLICTMYDMTYEEQESINAAYRAVKAALAAPARNCDRFGGDPRKLHDEWSEWSGERENCNADGTVKMAYGEWLLAWAKEGRGGEPPRTRQEAGA